MSGCVGRVRGQICLDDELMPLTTPEQYKTLESWSFIQFWQLNRTLLADLARRTYRRLGQHCIVLKLSAELWADRTAEALSIALQGTTIFIKVCENKERDGAQPSMSPVFAWSLACYIVDMDWPAVILDSRES